MWSFYSYKKVLIALLLVMIGFQISYTQKRKKETKTTPGGNIIEVSNLELRLTMDDFFATFVLTVTQAADSIINASSDYTIDNQALMWKINAIPVAQGSILSRDPFAAFVDMSVFSAQMKHYFESGNGSSLFGEYQEIAVACSNQIWSQLVETGEGIVGNGNFTNGIALIEDFASKNPIENSYFNRKSTLPLLARIQKEEKVKLKTLAESMAGSVDELTNRMNVYTTLLPIQMRWQAEYLMNNSISQYQLEQKYDSIYGLLDRAIVLAESTPGIVDTQRMAVFNDLGQERKIILDAIRQERMAVMALLQKERELILQSLNEEISFQREASMENLDQLSGQSINSSFDQLNHLADRLFWRSLILLLLFIAAVYIGIILYKRS